MKKLFLLLLIVFSTISLFANPLARIYRPQNEEYQLIESLSIESGIVPFSTSGLISGFELEKQLTKINTNKLSPYSLDIYNNLLNNIRGDNYKVWKGTAQINLEGYVNSNPNTKHYQWVEGYNQRSPLAYGEVESTFGPSGYATISVTLQKKFTENYFQGFDYNIIGLGDSSSDIQNNFPTTAFLGISGNWYTFLFGKNPIKLGRASTGNLMVNDHSPYHDFLSFSMFNKSLKYTFLAIPMNELMSKDLLNSLKINNDSLLGTGYYPRPYKEDGFYHTLFHNSTKRIYFAHRLEMDLFKWWRLAITEGTLFYTDSIDLRMFSPIMLMHNYQNFGEVNNSMGLESEFAISPHWLLNLQIFLDQIQTKGEQEDYGDTIPPNAYAFLLGGRFYYPLNDWTISGHIEGVYTSPFAYMRTGDNTQNYGGVQEEQYNLDFINVVNSYDNITGVNWLGYPLGPDTIVLSTSIKGEYKDLLKLNSSLDLVIQGERGLKIEGKVQRVKLYSYPANINPLTPFGPNPDYKLIIGTGVSFKIPKTNGTIYGQNYLINKWDNLGYDFDNQLTLGIAYSF